MLLLLPALGSLVLVGMLLTTRSRAETVHCDRAANLCTYFFPGPFNGDTYTDALANWKSSKVVARKSATTWKVERGTTPLWLGSDTQDAATIALYQQLSADLQAFLGDPARATYDASIPPPPKRYAGFVFIVLFGALCGLYGLRWWRGWYTELALDPAQRTIAIHRRPMFFTGPRTVTRPVRELKLVEAIENRYVGRGNRAKFAHFELRDAASGKRVFKYLAFYDRKNRAQLDGDMELLARFFREAGAPT
ncbi:MAG: hypothetical protein JO257_34960 [Deltaproteobacteria bacterium]|nr:hypothetical protein [Deltaproteobacteria bacterium]